MNDTNTTSNIQGDGNIAVQNVRGSTITIINAKGEKEEIQHTFNAELTRALMHALLPYDNKRQDIHTQLRSLEKDNPSWFEHQELSAGVKERLNLKMGAILGRQLRTLFSIGQGLHQSKENERDPDSYVKEAYLTAKYGLDFLIFVFLVTLKKENLFAKLTDEEREELSDFLRAMQTSSLSRQLQRMRLLLNFLKAQEKLPIPEAVDLDLSEESELVSAMAALDDLRKKSRYDLKDCVEAEQQITKILTHFVFFSRYKLVSVREVFFRNHEEHYYGFPSYLVEYTKISLQQTEPKRSYQEQPLPADTVMLRRGTQYLMNLSPFIIDYSAVSEKAGGEAQLCFYQYQSREEVKTNYRYLNLTTGQEKKTPFHSEYERTELKSSKVIDKFADKNARYMLNENILKYQLDEFALALHPQAEAANFDEADEEDED